MATKIRTITVRVDRTKHKKQPFKVTKEGRVEQELDERYTREHDACRGAVRACRDFLKGGKKDDLTYGSRVNIKLPGGRVRFGWLWYDGRIELGIVK